MGTWFGFQAIGKTVGAGLPAPTTGTDRWEPGTGAHSSLKIDALDRDFELDDYGNKKGMDDVQQRVYLCLRTLADTRKNFPDFGLRLPKKIQSEQIQPQIKEAVRIALKPVIDDGSVTLETVEIKATGTMVEAIIYWHNNRTKKQYATPIPLRR